MLFLWINSNLIEQINGKIRIKNRALQNYFYNNSGQKHTRSYLQ